MAWVAPLFYLHIIICLIILIGGHASEKDIRVPGATAPGDIIIGGIFAVHKAVIKRNDTFEPQIQECEK